MRRYLFERANAHQHKASSLSLGQDRYYNPWFQEFHFIKLGMRRWLSTSAAVSEKFYRERAIILVDGQRVRWKQKYD